VSWQALAADIGFGSDDLDDDDESLIAVVDAYREAYRAAADLVADRLNQSGAIVAAGGPFDQLITDTEWADLIDPSASDAVGDIVNDGLIAVAIMLGILSLGSLISIDEHTRPGDQASFLRELLDQFIDRNRDSGWSPAEWRRRLRGDAASPFSEPRADRWARTQARGALNAGYHAGLNTCRDVGAQNKAALNRYSCADVAAIRWVTERDERVRPAHEAVDTDTIPLGELFTVGGFSARFPGDPYLPIGLRINCRCRLAWMDGSEVRRIVGARFRELYQRARELDIRGRSKMNKAELQSAVMKELCLQGLAGGPDCPDLFDQMNRPTLLTHARREGIVGRSRMTRTELVEQLRVKLRGSDRLRVAQGYAPRTELNEAQRLARRKRAAASRLLGTTDRLVPDMSTRRQSRLDLFDEFGGPTRGHVPCVFCGLKLHPGQASGFAVLVPTPIRALSAGGSAAVSNMLPACSACFQAHSVPAVALAASGTDQAGLRAILERKRIDAPTSGR
jgi:hypothetical protein